MGVEHFNKQKKYKIESIPYTIHQDTFQMDQKFKCKKK